DDYFYPYEGTTTQDAETFRQYSRNIGNIADWRRDNVNIFVKMVSDSIRAAKPFVKFGISPFGIWRSGTPSGTSGLDAYSVVFCDATAWLQARTVDYIIPQLYWKLGGAQDFAKLMPWWNAQARQSGRQMYSGLGAYRLTDAAWTADDITRQIDVNREQNGNGIVFFSSNSLTRDLQGLRTALVNGAMRSPALVPTMVWKDSIAPNPPTNLRAVQSASTRALTLTWSAPERARDGDTAALYVVYRFADTAQIRLDNPASIVAITPNTTWTDANPPFRITPGSIQYAVTALDRLRNESNSAQVRFTTTSVSLQEGFSTGIQSISPNPAQNLAAIIFSLEKAAMVQIAVTDNIGRTVAVPLFAERSAGAHIVEFSTDNLAN
ncbi:MAG: glycoside hydrolase family 10 protein, partial [Candidatus Kapaibacteriota bacterium]